MSETPQIYSVMLIPAEGDPYGLVAEGVPVYVHTGKDQGIFGTFLPVIDQPWGYVAARSGHDWRMVRVETGEVSVRLIWRGELDPTAFDRVARLSGAHGPALRFMEEASDLELIALWSEAAWPAEAEEAPWHAMRLDMYGTQIEDDDEDEE